MKRLSILVADESPAVCGLVRRWLPHHHVTCVFGARDALNAACLLRFEFVVGDLHLALSGERHWFQELNLRQPWIRLLALCHAQGASLGANSQLPFQLGAHAAVAKPLRERSFVLAMRACWNDSVAPSSAPATPFRVFAEEKFSK